MNIQRPTTINLEREAVENSKARHVRVSLAETTRISTRDARAHSMLGGLQPGQSIHIASMGELSMHDAAAAIVEHYGPFDVLTLATWAASEEAIKSIIALRQSGGVGRIEALVDTRCPLDCAEAHALMSNKHGFDLYKTAGNHAKIMAFTRLNLLAWNGVFGLGVYVPMLSLTFQKKPQAPEDLLHSRRVYAFKQQGKHADEFKTAVEGLKAHFHCDDIVAVPRSTRDLNSLQELFGVKIERTIDVTPRKANHKAPIAPDYGQTYTLHGGKIAGPNVLLIDDIATTGVTLAHFAQALRAAGYRVIPAALALDHKLAATWISPGVAMVSTANLTKNPRCEVLCVTLSSTLAEFHRDWIREVLNAA